MSERRFRESVLDGTMPIAICPDGTTLYDTKELPSLPPPKKIVVGPDSVLIDEWAFRTVPITRGMFAWLQKQILAWAAVSGEPESKAQLFGLIEAWERQFVNGKNPPDASQTEFDF
jgi:hypothetical protein